MPQASHRKPRNHIRLCRKVDCYTQRDIAFLLGVSPRTVARWEQGSRTPSVHTAIGLAVCLHRLVDEVFVGCRKEWMGLIARRHKRLTDVWSERKVARWTR